MITIYYMWRGGGPETPKSDYAIFEKALKYNTRKHTVPLTVNTMTLNF